MEQHNSLEEVLIEPSTSADIQQESVNVENNFEEFPGATSVPSRIDRLGFNWFTPVLLKGKKNGKLEMGDLPPLPREIYPQHCKTAIRSIWTGPETTDAQLFWKLVFAGGVELIPLMSLRLTADFFTLVGPAVLGRMLNNFMTATQALLPSPIILDKDNPGDFDGTYVYSAIFLSTFVIKSFVESHFSYRRGVLKQKIQSGLTSELFSNVLIHSHQSAGEIQNLMSIDCDRASNLCLAFIDGFGMLMQLCGSLILLYINMAWTCIVGISLIFVMIPVNHWIAGMIQRSSSRMMAAKDSRSLLLSEFLRSIRSVKAYGWEAYFQTKIQEARTEEVHSLKVIKFSDSVCVFLWAMTSLLMSAGTFGVWSLMGKTLTTERVYPTLSLFNIIIVPINAIPWVINGMVESYVSLIRLDQYLTSVKMSQTMKVSDRIYSKETSTIKLNNALFSYLDGESINQFQLNVPTLYIQGKERMLVSVQGNIGSGKTCFLLALLDELKCTLGESLNTHKFITYAPQVPFLVPGSIKDNILFGSLFDNERYERVLAACCLQQDFLRLDGGDQFEIQDLSDLSLSGGQKARIMLARALYPQNSTLILIDDIIAALDIRTADQIVEKAILGDLTKNKTVMIVSNFHKVLVKANDSIMVDHGLVVQHRKFTRKKELKAQNSEQQSHHDDSSSIQGFQNTFIEDRDAGSVSLTTYQYYLQKQGIWVIIILISIGLMQISKNLTDLWLSYNVHPGSLLTEIHHLGESSFMSIYLVLVAVCSFFTLIRSFSFAAGGIISAVNIHLDLLGSIFSWSFINFLSHDSGQIMNRMVTDVALIDDSLPFILNIYLAQVFGMLGIAITIFVSQQRYAVYMIPIILALSCWFRHIQKEYTICSREIKRLESCFKAPLFSYFQSLSEGRVSIRAFQKTKYFTKVLDHHLVNYLTPVYASTCASAWLSLRLQLMSSFVALSIVLIGLYTKEQGSLDEAYPSLIGLSLSYLLPITSLLGGLVSSSSEVEREMVSVERVLKYIKGSNVVADNHEHPLRSSQVLHGDIVVDHLNFRYPWASDFTLKDVSITIPEFKRCVLCGRSGSGKSTLISCLLGLLPADAGNIFYGGIEIRKIAKSILCSSIGYLPQEPVLFSASIRENLDPYKRFQDEAIIGCLTQTGFGQAYWKVMHVSREMLDSPIKPSSLSTAEKSLFSLSRLFLQNPSYLFLDEPSAVMNAAELARVFNVLETMFKDSTIVESAHNLSRASSADLVAVIGDGKVIEVGCPNDLLEKDSEFSEMMQSYIR